jgi:S1-C subfamily serine protease
MIQKNRIFLSAIGVSVALSAATALAVPPDSDLVVRAESALINTIDKLSPAAVCIHDAAQRGGGSGVLIDAQGYGLTNFHVVAGMMEKRKGWGGLSDGTLYELEVLGVDPVGDVAMFRLKGENAFPFATLGDSDRVQIGDTVIAAGNPFILSEDYTPSISVGLVSGTHRYQKGVDGNLIYSDCLQVDAAINPGNSGGALFNAQGEVIGINGRISVGARGRLNVGHGFAISSNQIRRFIPALRGGLIARHGTLGAGVIELEMGRVLFVDVAPGGAADQAGIRNADRLLTFDGVPVRTQNVFASMLGTYPEDWPIALEVETDGKWREVTVRLDPVNPKMKAPFRVDRQVNLAQVRRLLNGFRRAVFRDASVKLPQSWTWTAKRDYLNEGGVPKFNEQYEVSALVEAPIRMVRRYDDGARGFEIIYDEASAVKHLAQDGDTVDLPTGDRIVLNALHVVRHRLLGELTDEQLADVVHSGADAMTSKDTEDIDTGQCPLLTQLEVIDWPLGGHTLARFSFDYITGRLLRIRVRDIATNERATIELSDYNWAAGFVLPHTLEVRTASSTYRETQSNWNVK